MFASCAGLKPLLRCSHGITNILLLSVLSNCGNFSTGSINLELHLMVKWSQQEGLNCAISSFNFGQSLRLSLFVFKALSLWEIGSLLLGDSGICFVLYGSSELAIVLCVNVVFSGPLQQQKGFWIHGIKSQSNSCCTELWFFAAACVFAVALSAPGLGK